MNFNNDLNEKPENIYTKFYPTVARRVIDSEVRLAVPKGDGDLVLSLSPLDPGVVFEKIVVDFGGYKPSYLFGKESPCTREVSSANLAQNGDGLHFTANAYRVLGCRYADAMLKTMGLDNVVPAYTDEKHEVSTAGRSNTDEFLSKDFKKN